MTVLLKCVSYFDLMVGLDRKVRVSIRIYTLGKVNIHSKVVMLIWPAVVNTLYLALSQSTVEMDKLTGCSLVLMAM